MAIYCKHTDCSLEAIDELMLMYRILGRIDALQAALRVATEDPEVRCRHVDKQGQPMEESQ